MVHIFVQQFGLFLQLFVLGDLLFELLTNMTAQMISVFHETITMLGMPRISFCPPINNRKALRYLATIDVRLTKDDEIPSILLGGNIIYL